MTQRTEQHDHWIVVHLAGDIDMNTSPAAREAILKAIRQNKDLLVDLSAVTYIDSSGVANLVEGYQLARQHSVHFGLVGVSPAAENVLRLARLDQVFPMHASLNDWANDAHPPGA